jgi:peptidoglycan/xylan/chitin deacetylase (PgdA/CDA1 family)
MLGPVFSLASPGGRGGRLSILIFHRVLAHPDPLFPAEPTAERFDRICGWLANWFQVLPLDEAVQRLRAASLPPRAAAITFDDGYADNHDVALPILRQHSLSATFFIATGFLGGGRMWNDTVIESVRRTQLPRLDLRGLWPDAVAGHPTEAPVTSVDEKRALIDRLLPAIKYLPVGTRREAVQELARRAGAELPADLMMSSAQVRGLRRAGMSIGAHTVSHPILAGMQRAAVREEIAGSREVLEGLLGERVSLFAYPNGKPGTDYDAASVAVVRELGFDAAVSTSWGAADRSSDNYQLPRFTPWDIGATKFALRLLGNLRRDAAVTV